LQFSPLGRHETLLRLTTTISFFCLRIGFSTQVRIFSGSDSVQFVFPKITRGLSVGRSPRFCLVALDRDSSACAAAVTNAGQRRALLNEITAQKIQLIRAQLKKLRHAVDGRYRE